MKCLAIGIVLLGAVWAQADCRNQAMKTLVALSSAGDIITPQYMWRLADSTEVDEEGEKVVIETYRAHVGDVSSADVLLYKSWCRLKKIEISYGD